MTIKATLIAARPEATRIFGFLDRDFSDEGAAVGLREGADGAWRVEAYFENGESESIAAAIRDRLGADAFGARLTAEAVAETNWIALGLAELKPVRAGRFIVHGRHDRTAIPPGRVAIEIEAGQAFGTGHHGTTAGCLTILDGLLKARRFRNPLDLGTGSGVLAIALAKVLRRPVLATDIDPVAAAVAAENARLNRVGALVATATASGMAHAAIRRRAPYDLIVANILAEPLMRLAPVISAALASGGVLVLSGLLRKQRERVVAAYGAQGVRLVSARIFGGWAVLTLTRF